jgi:hypothetical protein
MDDYLPRIQHVLPLVRSGLLAFLALAFANIYLKPKALQHLTRAQVIISQAMADPRPKREPACFLTTNADIRRKVLSRLSVRDVIRYSTLEKDWRAILQERAQSTVIESTVIHDWYFPVWFHGLHPERARDRDPVPTLTPPLLPTRRYTNLTWHGVHHDYTSLTDDQSLPFLDFLWDAPGSSPLGFILSTTSAGLLLFYKFTFHHSEIIALLTVCNPFTKLSRDLPFLDYVEYQDINDLPLFIGDDMHLIVDSPTEYRVVMVTESFVKEWSSVSNEWRTSFLDMWSFVVFSSLFFEGSLFVLRKWGSAFVVGVLERNARGIWVAEDGIFATVYENEEMYIEGTRFGVESMHLLGCNGLLYAVMLTEKKEEGESREMDSVEFHLFELPEGCRKFVRVAHIPFSYFTTESRQYKFERHSGKCYQGFRGEKFCCTAKGKEIWIACQGYLFCYDVVTRTWRKEEHHHTNNFEDSIPFPMPFEPSFSMNP